MSAQSFAHERLDVYRLSIDFISWLFEASQSLEGLLQRAHDQWLRTALKFGDAAESVQSVMLKSSTITICAPLRTSTNPRPKKGQVSIRLPNLSNTQFSCDHRLNFIALPPRSI